MIIPHSSSQEGPRREITQVTTKRGKLIYLLSSEEILAHRQVRGTHLRAFCPIHGSDHQRSLSIHQQTGWGYCHQCHARVFVAALNPSTAQELLSWAERQYDMSLHWITPQVTPRKQRSRRAVADPHWQQAEVDTLRTLFPWFQDALADIQYPAADRARRYLRHRGIPLDLALDEAVGYVPEALLQTQPFRSAARLLWRWRDRVLFRLWSPQGDGFIGRTLWGWQEGMSEQEHSRLLDEKKVAPKRWLKTWPAGWFATPPLSWPARLALVEGVFDRLSLLAAGAKRTQVIALTGTAVTTAWFPEQVRHLHLGFDRDQGGFQALVRTARQCSQSGLIPAVCLPPPDPWGTDWNERWQVVSTFGVAPLLRALTPPIVRKKQGRVISSLATPHDSALLP